MYTVQYEMALEDKVSTETVWVRKNVEMPFIPTPNMHLFLMTQHTGLVNDELVTKVDWWDEMKKVIVTLGEKCYSDEENLLKHFHNFVTNGWEVKKGREWSDEKQARGDGVYADFLIEVATPYGNAYTYKYYCVDRLDLECLKIELPAKNIKLGVLDRRLHVWETDNKKELDRQVQERLNQLERQRVAEEGSLIEQLLEAAESTL
jgi:hypothetical protein